MPPKGGSKGRKRGILTGVKDDGLPVPLGSDRISDHHLKLCEDISAGPEAIGDYSVELVVPGLIQLLC